MSSRSRRRAAEPARFCEFRTSPNLCATATPGGGRHDDSEPGSERLSGARALTHSPLAWAVTIFFAIQSASFYATIAWLPSIYESHGASDSKAALLLSLSIVVGVIAAPTVPAIAVRMREQRTLVVVFAGLTPCR